MPQTLKSQVRDRIVAAAEAVFAAHGFRGATMAKIAKQAALSTGNLYRYFESKEALFDFMLGDEFVDRFEQLLDSRVDALAQTDLVHLSNEAKASDARLVRFWLDHRLRVVVLLDRAQGSKHEDFGDRFVQRLVESTKRSLSTPVPPAADFMLEQIFQTSRRAIVAILERHRTEPALLEAFEAFRSYQLAGLAGFRRWMNDR